MKIRILDNSVRIRFSQKELDELFKSGKVSKKTCFPNNSVLIYSLVSSSDSNQLKAEYSNGEIKIIIPKEKVKELHNTDLVGMENVTDGLNLLVEKDFKCLTDRNEEEADLFENPLNKESC